MIKNKKAMIDDFGSLLIVGIILVIIILVLLFYVGLTTKKYSSRPDVVSNLEQASYTTRTILEWELESGMKVHESLIKYNEEKNLTQFVKEIENLLIKQNLLSKNSWMILIKNAEMQEPLLQDTWYKGKFENTLNRAINPVRNSYLALTRVTIPDHNNNLIEIVIKPITKEDQELYKELENLLAIESIPTSW